MKQNHIFTSGWFNCSGLDRSKVLLPKANMIWNCSLNQIKQQELFCVTILFRWEAKPFYLADFCHCLVMSFQNPQTYPIWTSGISLIFQSMWGCKDDIESLHIDVPNHFCISSNDPNNYYYRFWLEQTPEEVLHNGPSGLWGIHSISQPATLHPTNQKPSWSDLQSRHLAEESSFLWMWLRLLQYLSLWVQTATHMIWAFGLIH